MLNNVDATKINQDFFLNMLIIQLISLFFEDIHKYFIINDPNIADILTLITLLLF